MHEENINFIKDKHHALHIFRGIQKLLETIYGTQIKTVSSITLNENENFNDKIGAGKKHKLQHIFLITFKIKFKHIFINSFS